MDKKTNKRYYWLKLQSTYFNKLEQKKMKKQENGKDMQIVYLRMMLSSVDKGGYIYYQGVYDTLEEELAEEFDEDVNIISSTLEYLKKSNMITIYDNYDCFIPEVLEHTGSEGYSAERMRRMRNKKKLSQCDIDVTSSDEETEIETEIEIEKETETETETETKKDNMRSVSAPVNFNPSSDLFTLSELLEIAENNKILISEIGIKTFLSAMWDSGWILYNKPVEKENIVRVLRAYLKYNDVFRKENVEDEEELVGDDWWKVEEEEEYTGDWTTDPDLWRDYQ